MGIAVLQITPVPGPPTCDFFLRGIMRSQRVGGGGLSSSEPIGVTGHRNLADVAAVEAGIEMALTAIAARFPEPPWRVLSAPAEGADRIVARHVLARPGALLAAVLPLPVTDYMTDFKSQQSRDEFLTLLSKAESVIELPTLNSRTESYEQAGRYVAEHSDVLLAVWDGLPPRGRAGTAEIAVYARGLGKPICHVWTSTGASHERAPVEYINFP